MKRGAIKFLTVGLSLCWMLTLGSVLAEDKPMIGLSVSNESVSKGETITYNFNYSNGTSGDIKDAVVTLDRPIDGGLSFISSNYPVEWTPDSRPIFRLGNVNKNFSGGVVSLTVRVNSNYLADSITAVAGLKGTTNEGEVSISSAATSVAIAVPKEEKKDTQESDQTKVVTKEATPSPSPEAKKLNLMAEGVDKIEVNKMIGLADLSKFKQTSQWDKKILYVGVVAFVLIIIVGIAGYFIGRKSK